MVFNPLIHNRSDKNWTFGRSEFKGSGLIASRFFSMPLILLVTILNLSTFEPLNLEP